jgi:hypothetical protein
VADPVQREHLMSLAKQGRGQAWWQPSGLPAALVNGACVEVAPIDGMIAMRDSKDPDGAVLFYTQAEWSLPGWPAERRIR